MATKLKPPNDTYMVGWITANADQTMAAEDFFDQWYQLAEHKAPGDSNQYTLGLMGKHNVVMTEMPAKERSSSESAAAKVASDMMQTFPQIRVVLFVGTGSGVHSDKHRVRLGDVVVSYYGVIQYDCDATAKAKAFQGVVKSVYAPDSVWAAVKSLTRRYLAATNPLGTAVDYMISSFPSQKKSDTFGRPGEEFDRLYKADFAHRQRPRDPCHLVCGNEENNLEDRSPLGKYDDSPAVHLGVIASGSRQIRDPHLRAQLTEEKDIACFESEAAGFMSNVPCLLIRGITDYADTHSSSRWHGYAAVAASAYARHVLHVLTPEQLKAERTLQSYAESSPSQSRTFPLSSESAGIAQPSGSTQSGDNVPASLKPQESANRESKDQSHNPEAETPTGWNRRFPGVSLPGGGKDILNQWVWRKTGNQ